MVTNILASPSIVDLSARGPLSESVLGHLTGSSRGDAYEHEEARGHTELAHRTVEQSPGISNDDDIQLALFYLYASSYGSLEQISPDLEWDTELVETRRVLEKAFERELRESVPVPDLPSANADDVARALFDLTGAETGPGLSHYFAKKASRGQAREMLMQRSIYTLREADPHSWAIPRLRGRAKAALVEIQSDEYGGGRPDRVHAEIFAVAMRGAGLDDTYGAYLNDVPAITLASNNLMAMFGLNRRLLGAIVGHLAAFEMTSSIPCRFYSEGLRRLGFGSEVTDYFDEHVEADAVHEQIAGRDMAGSLAEDHPELLPDIMFGAAACLTIDGCMGDHMLERWSNDETSLRAGSGKASS